MAIRGKNKNPYDELVGFCTVNRIGAKEEMRLRKIIDGIIESKLHQPTVISSGCCDIDHSEYKEVWCEICEKNVYE